MKSPLIPVFHSQEQELLCNARDLHSFLEVGRDFSNWIRGRIEQYGFVEGEDYLSVQNLSSPDLVSAKAEIFCSPDLASKNRDPRGGHNRVDYHLTLDTAKELAMVENNAKGREVRCYFIRVEKDARERRGQLGTGAKQQRLEENKRITQHQEAAIRLMEKIRREHRPEIREAMHTAMVHNCQAGKMPAPPLEALGGPDLVERSRLDIFWNTVSELIAKGEEINHSHDPARLAVSLPHLQRLAEKHHLTLPKLSLLRRTLRGSETPLFIDYRTVNSGLFGGSVKCWVFAQEDDATQETGNGHF